MEVGAGAGAAGGLEGFGAPARSLELITLSNSCGDVVSKYLATAADFSADLTSAGDALGRNCRYRAAAPAAWGVAMLVPLITPSAVSLFQDVLVMNFPGAKTLRHFPMLEKLASVSDSVVAPTAMAEAALQGDIVQAPPPLLLPAAATTTNEPACETASTASFRAAERGPANDIATTADEMLLRALWSFTHCRADTMLE